MITFEPDSPWEVGQVVVFRDGDKPIYHKRVVSVEHSDDGSETKYELVNHQCGECKQWFIEQHFC